MSKDLKKLSKFLALILRHNPDDFGLTLDEQGFTLLEPVWQVIQNKYGTRYDVTDLETLVAGDDNGKKRYEIANGKIRAMYGHSQSQVRDIEYVPAVPPDILYHGTNAGAVHAIRKEGLTAQKRQYVHLTTNSIMRRMLRHAARISLFCSKFVRKKRMMVDTCFIMQNENIT